MKKTNFQLRKMQQIFEARTNNYIKEIAKKMINEINKKWESDSDILDYLKNEELERIWRNLYKWKLPKNITMSGKDEYFLI